MILFTVGFASAISLIFLVSFNFQPASAVKSNDVKLVTQKQYTTNDEAYRFYLLGSALVDKLTRDDGAKAIEALTRAGFAGNLVVGWSGAASEVYFLNGGFVFSTVDPVGGLSPPMPFHQ